MFRSFLLEDEFNNQEGNYEFCMGSGAPLPNSINDLLALFDSDQKEEILDGLVNLKLDYSSKFGEDGRFYTSGASEGIFLVFSTLFAEGSEAFQAGDTIVVQRPIYQSLYQIALDMGVNVIFWDYDQFQGFEENFSRLKRIFNSELDPCIKALVLNNPNNPTGIAFDNQQLSSIADLLRAYGSNNSQVKQLPYLIVDEVFQPLSESPSAIEVYENSIVISDLSKSYGFAGLRLGWIDTSDEALKEKFLSQRNYLSLRANTVAEYLLPFIMEKKEHFLGAIRTSCLANRKFLIDNYDKGLKLSRLFELPESFLDASQTYSGLTIFPRFREELLQTFGVEELEKALIAKKIFLVPGKLFGDQYSNHFRLGISLMPSEFEKVISQALETMLVLA